MITARPRSLQRHHTRSPVLCRCGGTDSTRCYHNKRFHWRLIRYVLKCNNLDSWDLTQSCKNPTNLQTWFGGRLWPNNEEGLVCQCSDTPRVAKTPPTYKPGLEEGFGQTMRKVLFTVLRYPSAGKVGIN